MSPSATLGPVAGLMIDLDGVLYVGDRPVPGAREALEAITAAGIPCRFLTNTTTRGAAAVSDKLHGLGFPIEDASIFSAVSATLGYLRDQPEPPSIHPVVRDSILPEFREFARDDERPDFVIIGDIGAAWSYALMNQIFRQLDRGSRLLAMHRNRYFQTEEGLSVDIGCFVAGLEAVSGQQAIVIGKPSPDFFRTCLDSLELKAEEVVMIGDDIESDVGAAQACGIRGALVKTGKFRPGQLDDSEVDPDALLGSFAELPAALGLE